MRVMLDTNIIIYIILHTAIIENVGVFITGDKDFYDVKIDKPKIMGVSKFLEKYC